jgi:hypothetical protein
MSTTNGTPTDPPNPPFDSPLPPPPEADANVYRFVNINQLAAELVAAIPHLAKENVVNQEDFILSRLKPIFAERNYLYQRLIQEMQRVTFLSN